MNGDEKMKKVISAFICCMMVFNLMINCIAVEAKNQESSSSKAAGGDTAFNQAFEILNSIGILTEYDELTLNTEKEVSRAEFADTLAKVLKVDSENTDKMYYYDVSKNHFAYKSITALTERGYMSGVGANMFSPDDIMENKNAVRALANVLGYSYRLTYSKSPEGELIRLAKDAGLSDNITLSGNMTFRDMVIIMKNALVAPTMQINGISGTDIDYEKSEDITLLSLHYDSHYVEDKRVIAANGVSIYGGNVSENKIQIDKIEYIQPKKDMENYLGSYVNFIYKGDLSKEECKITWISKSESNEELNIEKTQSDAFNTSTYKLSYYDKNDKQKDVQISRNATVIYNGGFVENIEDVLTKSEYDARIVKNQNGIYDLVVISEYTNFIVGSVNPDDYTLKSKSGSDTLNLKETDYTYMLLTAGDEVTTSDNVSNGDVISVYKSQDGKYIRMAVSSNKVKGVVQAKGFENNIKYITVNDVKYNPYRDTNTDKCIINANVCLYLDANGKIAYVQNVNADFSSMYVTAVAWENASLDGTLRIKGFNNEGSFGIYDAASKITVNGVTYKNGFDKADYNTVKNTIVEKITVYKLNSKGEITEIDSAGVSDKVKITSPLGSKNYRTVSAKLGKMACVDAETVIFAVPSDITDEDAFSIKKIGALGDWMTFNAESYQIEGNDDGIEDIAVIKGYDWFSATLNSALFAVSEISEGLNEEQEAVPILTGYQGSSEKIYYCDSSFNVNDVKKGDLVRLSFNAKNYVTGVIKKYNKDSAIGESTAALTDQQRYLVGYVNDVIGDVIKVSYSDGSTVDELFKVGSTPVLVYDENNSREQFKIGSISDLDAYAKLGKGSKIIIQTYQMNQMVIMVYK